MSHIFVIPKTILCILCIHVIYILVQLGFFSLFHKKNSQNKQIIYISPWESSFKNISKECSFLGKTHQATTYKNYILPPPLIKINNYYALNESILLPENYINSQSKTTSSLPHIESMIECMNIKKILLYNLLKFLSALKHFKNLNIQKILLYDENSLFIVCKKNTIFCFSPWQKVNDTLKKNILMLQKSTHSFLNNKKNYYFDMRLSNDNKIIYTPLTQEVYHELF